MTRIHITKCACAIAAGLLIGAGLSTVSAQTLIWADSFPDPAGTTIDTASASDITGVDSGANAAYPHAVNVEQTIDGNGNLVFPNNGVESNWIDFSPDPSDANTHYDFSSGAGGADILAAGGFTVSFTWEPNDDTTGNWLFFSVNSNDNTGNAGYGGNYNNPLFDGTNGGAAESILFGTTGTTLTSQEGVFPIVTGSFTPNVDLSDSISLTYSFNSWAAGSPVGLVADVNGVQALADSFEWNNDAGGAIYFDLGSYDLQSGVTDLEIETIATVPEPGTYGMAILGLGALVACHRLRGGLRGSRRAPV